LNYKTQKQSVLVPRGNCTFTEKTSQAEKAKIDLLIIFDTSDQKITLTGYKNFINTTTIWINNKTY
jgi:hypothetical protein